MKLMRIGNPGAERPCLLDAGGTVRDISSIVGDIGPGTIDGIVERLAGVDPSALPELASEGVRIAPPMAQPRTIFCIGLNYSDHAAESGLAVPDEPILFSKAAAAFCGPNDPVPYSDRMSKLDWEIELGIVIGKRALEMFNNFAVDPVTRDLPAVLLLDEPQRDWKALATTSDKRRCLAMPVKLRELREAILSSVNA